MTAIVRSPACTERAIAGLVEPLEAAGAMAREGQVC